MKTNFLKFKLLATQSQSQFAHFFFAIHSFLFSFHQLLLFSSFIRLVCVGQEKKSNHIPFRTKLLDNRELKRQLLKTHIVC